MPAHACSGHGQRSQTCGDSECLLHLKFTDCHSHGHTLCEEGDKKLSRGIRDKGKGVNLESVSLDTKRLRVSRGYQEGVQRMSQGVKRVSRGRQEDVKRVSRGWQEGGKWVSRGCQDREHVRQLSRGYQEGIKRVSRGCQEGVKKVSRSVKISLRCQWQFVCMLAPKGEKTELQRLSLRPT